MASSKYFGRAYRLTLHDPNGGTTVFETKDGMPAMDIKFDVTYALGQTAREGTVSILGLTHERIHKYIDLAAMDRGSALSQRMRLTLEVGYLTGQETVEVLNGFVWYATVTSPPQMWLNMKVSEYDPMGSKTIKMPEVSQDVPMRQLLQEICDAISDSEDGEGIPCAFEDKTEDLIIDGDDELKTIELGDKATLSDIISKLNSSYDKAQFVLRTRKGDDTLVIEGHDKEKMKAVRGTVKVDKESGLLSVTGLDAVSGCITTFLDGGVTDELCRLELTSDLNPQANGTYLIIKKQYLGHFMGQEWYTRYYCSAREE